jgi:hypothetical protein
VADGDTGPARLPRATLAPAAVPTPPPPDPRGIVRLVVVPEAEAFVDGAPIGRVAARDVTLEPGEYTLRIVHPEYRPYQRKVTVRREAVERVVIDLTEMGVKIRR